MSDDFRTEIIDGMSLYDYLEQPGVSASLLNDFALCPLEAYEAMTAAGRGTPTEEMVIGSAVDMLICEPASFPLAFAIEPETYQPVDKSGNPSGEPLKWNNNAKACKEWRRQHSMRYILSQKSKGLAERMAEAVLSDRHAKELLTGAKVQQSVFWRDERTGLQMKGRPDFVQPRVAIDLKTTGSVATDVLSRQIGSRRWYVQAAIYSVGLEANGHECNTFYLVAVSRQERPKVNVRRLKLRAVELGRYWFEEQLIAYRACAESGKWPGYSGDGEILDIDVPEYVHSSRGGSAESVELIIGGEAHAL